MAQSICEWPDCGRRFTKDREIYKEITHLEYCLEHLMEWIYASPTYKDWDKDGEIKNSTIKEW